MKFDNHEGLVALLNHSTSMNKRDQWGMTPIMTAVVYVFPVVCEHINTIGVKLQVFTAKCPIHQSLS